MYKYVHIYIWNRIYKCSKLDSSCSFNNCNDHYLWDIFSVLKKKIESFPFSIFIESNCREIHDGLTTSCLVISSIIKSNKNPYKILVATGFWVFLSSILFSFL